MGPSVRSSGPAPTRISRAPRSSQLAAISRDTSHATRRSGTCRAAYSPPASFAASRAKRAYAIGRESTKRPAAPTSRSFPVCGTFSNAAPIAGGAGSRPRHCRPVAKLGGIDRRTIIDSALTASSKGPRWTALWARACGRSGHGAQSKPVYLRFDCGTSRLKALLTDERGEVLRQDRAQRPGFGSITERTSSIAQRPRSQMKS
jgi:hypothetical protein